MAIQPMALAVDTGQPIDGIGEFAKGAQTGMALEGMKREQAMQGISMIAQISLGAMGGDLNGEVNPQHFEQGLDLLEQQGIDVSTYRNKPELAKVAARASLSALEQLKLAQDERAFQLALKKFDADLNGGSAENFGVNPLEGTIDGQPAYLQVGNKGSIKQVNLPEGWQASSQFEKVDTADGTLVINKKTNEETFIPKNLREAEAEKAAGKIEGEREGTAPERMKAATAALNDYKRQNKTVTENIDSVISEIEANPWLTAGFLGSKIAGVKGTPPYNIAKSLDTILANIGFDKLQAMREASPTGGALGQVSERENVLLQAVQGSLDQGQTPEQLIKNLKRVKQLAAEVLADREGAFNKDFGSPDANKPSTGTGSDELPEGTIIENNAGQRLQLKNGLWEPMN